MRINRFFLIVVLLLAASQAAAATTVEKTGPLRARYVHIGGVVGITNGWPEHPAIGLVLISAAA